MVCAVEDERGGGGHVQLHDPAHSHARGDPADRFGTVERGAGVLAIVGAVGGATASVIYVLIAAVSLSALAWAIFVTRHEEEPQVVEGEAA